MITIQLQIALRRSNYGSWLVELKLATRAFRATCHQLSYKDSTGSFIIANLYNIFCDLFAVNKSRLQVTFELKRYPLSFFLQSYFPAMSMVTLAGLGMWIDPRSVPARVALGKRFLFDIYLNSDPGRICHAKGNSARGPWSIAKQIQEKRICLFGPLKRLIGF